MHENWNPESSATQKARIKNYLLAGNSITPLEALNMYGCFRLAAVVFEIKKDGLDIKTEKVKMENGKYVARYSLNKKTDM